MPCCALQQALQHTPSNQEVPRRFLRDAKVAAPLDALGALQPGRRQFDRDGPSPVAQLAAGHHATGTRREALVAAAAPTQHAGTGRAQEHVARLECGARGPLGHRIAEHHFPELASEGNGCAAWSSGTSFRDHERPRLALRHHSLRSNSIATRRRSSNPQTKQCPAAGGAHNQCTGEVKARL